eukprot:gene7959-8779_t
MLALHMQSTWGILKKLPTLSSSLRLAFRSEARLLSHTRQNADDLSLDSYLLATSPELVISHLTSRHADPKVIEEVHRVQTLRQARTVCIKTGDAARNLRKTLSKEIGLLMKAGDKEKVEQAKSQVEEASAQAAKADEEQAVIDQQIEAILSIIPNLLDSRVPEGADDKANPVVHSWEGSRPRKVGETYLWHDDIARKLGGYDVDAAARISGARFSVLVGSVARLERALTQFFLDFHTGRGYKEVSVPYIVSRSTLYGTGQLPKFEEDLFKVSHSVAGEDAFLIPTAEVPVTNLFRNQILNDTQLPIYLACHSPCFRAEAGSYGRDTRGLLRQHQFQKVELVKICEPDKSKEEHEKLTQDAEALLQALDLPYRRVLLCGGDTGFSARICYDLEVWLPGQQAYREISSCSNCYDFQARRMMLRYRSKNKDEKEKKPSVAYVHTLNGSGLAVGRALVAVLENYQEADGSVTIPEVLRPYMGGLEKISPSEKDFHYN